MMLGLRSVFDYFECKNCASLAICEIPPDLGKYYPSDYYSFCKDSKLKTTLKRSWAQESAGIHSMVGELMVKLYGHHQGVRAIASLGMPLDSRILDVGCGKGDLLVMLEHLGYTALVGVDPFLDRSSVVSSYLSLVKQNIGADNSLGLFDLICFNHSLEHVADPFGTLQHAIAMLAPKGRILVRIPVAGSYAWRKYATNWVALDAPRHLVIPTRAAMQIVAERLKLQIVNSYSESDEFMIWGSEEYANGVPLSSPKSRSRKLFWRLFPDRKTLQMRELVGQLNGAGESDTACYMFSVS